ncbi:MAG: GAF domain-containing protein [Desulfobacterales bacterium]|nr:GAF domain-containing protein [Desulfobacterales bacterium]
MSKEYKPNIHDLENKLFRVLEISRKMSSYKFFDGLMELIIKETTELMEAERCTLYLFDRHKQEVYSAVTEGENIDEIRVPIDENSITGYSITHKKLLNIPDAYSDLDTLYKGLKFNTSFDKKNNFKTKSVLCAPIINANNSTIGVVQVLNKKNDRLFDEVDEKIFQALCIQAAITIENAHLYGLTKYYTIEDRNQLKGNKKVFTVFFDLRNYTGLNEELGNDKIKSLTEMWENDQINVLKEYGGIFLKSAGDQVMGVFGLYEPINDKDYENKFANLFKEIESLDFNQQLLMLSDKSSIKPLEPLTCIIIKLLYWYFKNKKRLSPEDKKNFFYTKELFEADNVIRYMFRAQQRIDWLNIKFISSGLRNKGYINRIFMKGGAEYGEVIVDFDIYGRLDVRGDAVNVASRVTDAAGTFAKEKVTDDNPIVIGNNFFEVIKDANIANITEKKLILRGKKEIQTLYILDSIKQFENKINLSSMLFNSYKAYIESAMTELLEIKQGILPYNFYAFNIEDKKKYQADHSKRVAMLCLFLIDEINAELDRKILYEKDRINDLHILFQDAQNRVNALSKRLKGETIDEITIQIENQTFENLLIEKQINYLFTIEDMSAWSNKNKNQLLSDGKLYEKYLHEKNLLENAFNSKALSNETRNGSESPDIVNNHILNVWERLFYQKQDIIEDTKNSLLNKNKNILKHEDAKIKDEEKKNIIYAALVHDIGKSSISDDIKGYDDPMKSIEELSIEEREKYGDIMSAFGSSIISGIAILKPIAEIIRWQHLHYNGKYYNAKLQDDKNIKIGEDIPRGSRVLAVANAFDAMTSDKPRRPSISVNEASKILENESAYDPGIIDLLLRKIHNL